MIYIGRRMGSDDKPLQAFLHNKKEFYWKRIKFLLIGGKYEVTSDFKMNRRPKFLGFIDDIPQEWRDSDSAVDEEMKRRREYGKAKNIVDPHWDALKPLHLRAKKLNYFERSAFAKHVARLILEGRKK